MHKKKKARKRKNKLPKNHDPAITPDPERWLPLRERSYYKRNRSQKKRDQLARVQGGSTSAAQIVQGTTRSVGTLLPEKERERDPHEEKSVKTGPVHPG